MGWGAFGSLRLRSGTLLPLSCQHSAQSAGAHSARPLTSEFPGNPASPAVWEPASLPHHCPCSGPPFIGGQSSLAATPSLFLCPSRTLPRPPEAHTAELRWKGEPHLAGLEGSPDSLHPTPQPQGSPWRPYPPHVFPPPVSWPRQMGGKYPFPPSAKAVAVTRAHSHPTPRAQLPLSWPPAAGPMLNSHSAAESVPRILRGKVRWGCRGRKPVEPQQAFGGLKNPHHPPVIHSGMHSFIAQSFKAAVATQWSMDTGDP